MNTQHLVFVVLSGLLTSESVIVSENISDLLGICFLLIHTNSQLFVGMRNYLVSKGGR